MYLHGDGLDRLVERWDPAYYVAWNLDAALSKQALSDAHLKSIRGALEKQVGGMACAGAGVFGAGFGFLFINHICWTRSYCLKYNMRCNE